MRKLLALAILAALLIPAAAFADNPPGGPGNRTNIPGHPRVDQVNNRVRNQHARIQQGVKSGKITQAQANQLYKQRHQIKTEERSMRAQDNGHLTKGDQKVINHQLNQRSKEIYNEKH